LLNEYSALLNAMHTRPVQALERGLRILQRVSRAEAGMGVGELAAELGLKAPTVHNLLRTLAAAGFLTRTADPVRFRLGPSARELAGSPAGDALANAAGRELLALHARHPAAVFTFSRASAQTVAVVLRVSPDASGRLQRPDDRTLHPYHSATALLFQAFWTPEQRDAFVLLHPFWTQGAPLWGKPEALRAFLDDVRRAGVSIPRFRGGEEILAAAVPVFAADGSLVAALGGAIPDRRLGAVRRKALLGDLSAAANRLTKGESTC